METFSSYIYIYIYFLLLLFFNCRTSQDNPPNMADNNLPDNQHSSQGHSGSMDSDTNKEVGSKWWPAVILWVLSFAGTSSSIAFIVSLETPVERSQQMTPTMYGSIILVISIVIFIMVMLLLVRLCRDCYKQQSYTISVDLKNASQNRR